MASINLQGILVDSIGEIDVGGVITFTHLTTTGQTIASTQVDLVIPPDGSYSIDVEYGQIRIDYTTRNTERFVANVIVNSDSTATSIPELLSASTPVAKPVIIQMQGLVADAVTAKEGAELAEVGAEAAEAGAVAAEAGAEAAVAGALADIVNIRRETVHNISVLTDAVANTDIAVGDAINLAERTTGNGGGAMWDVVLASGVTANTFNIVACTGIPTLALVLRVGESVDLRSFGASTTIVDNTPFWDAAINLVSSLGIKLVVVGTFPFTQTAYIKGGTYSVDMTSGKILSAATVVRGVVIGGTSDLFIGNLYGLNCQKTARNWSIIDYGIVYVNVAEAYMDSPQQRNFYYGQCYMPEATCRVAYNTTDNVLSFGSVFSLIIQPQAENSYCTENTWVGGRCHATAAGTLNTHIYLTDLGTTKTKVEHNRFYGVSIEGWSGGGTSGVRAVWCEHGSHNLFHHCRSEKYNDGWSYAAYQFANASQHNDVVDMRFETRVQDDSTGNGQSFRTSDQGMLINKRSGSPDESALTVKRNTNAVSTPALSVLDTGTNTSGISLLALQSLSDTFTVRGEEVVTVTTQTGKVLTIDDQGSLLPLGNNKGHLGNTTQRWKEVFTNLGQYADEAAANAAGVTTGQLYRTPANVVMVKF